MSEITLKKTLLLNTLGIKPYLNSLILKGLINWILNIAITIFLFRSLGSAKAALYMGLREIVYLVLSPLAGYILDKYGEKKILIFTVFLNIMTIISILYLIKFKVTYFILFLIPLFLKSFSGALDYPIQLSIPKLLVKEQILLQLNGIISSINTIIMMVIPVISSLFLIKFGLTQIFIVAIILNLVLFLVYFLLPQQINNKKEHFTVHSHPLLDLIIKTKDGFKFIFSDKTVSNSNYILFFFHIIIGAFNVLIPIISINSSLGEAGIGYLVSIKGIGSLLAIMYSSRLKEKNWIANTFISNLFLVITLIFLSLFHNTIFIFIGIFFIGFFSMLSENPIMTLIQKNIPKLNAGQIYAAIDSIIMGGIGFGSILAGIFIEHFNYKISLIILSFAPIFCIFFIKKLRNFLN